jgi:hypothetical protein
MNGKLPPNKYHYERKMTDTQTAIAAEDHMIDPPLPSPQTVHEYALAVQPPDHAGTFAFDRVP